MALKMSISSVIVWKNTPIENMIFHMKTSHSLKLKLIEIKVDQKTLQTLSNDDKSNLKEYGSNIDL